MSDHPAGHRAVMDAVPERTRCVLVLSPHEVVRVGLATVLARFEGIEVTAGGVEDHPAGGLELAQHDVVLHDVVDLHEGGAERLRRLVRTPDLAVVAVTRDLRPDLGQRAIDLGIDDCVSLGWPAARIVSVVRHVRPAATARLGGDGPRGVPARPPVVNPAPVPLSGLTVRETEVLSRITRGMSNEEIAHDLYLSINSVKTYVRTAYRRIGVSRRAQAVVWGIQHGFLTDGLDEATAVPERDPADRRP